MSETAKTFAQDAARDYAWKHFDVHAKQRIEVFKCYLTLVTITFGGYGIAFQNHYKGLGIAVAVFSLILAILFYRLDCRTCELIKVPEEYLKEEENRLAAILGTEKIKLMHISDRLSDESAKSGRKNSYTFIFRTFFVVNGVLAVLMAIAFLTFQTSSTAS